MPTGTGVRKIMCVFCQGFIFLFFTLDFAVGLSLIRVPTQGHAYIGAIYLLTSPLTHIRSPEEQTRSRFTGAAAVAEEELAGAGEAGGRGVSTATCITRAAAAAADGGSNRTPLQWATVSTTKVSERERERR